MSRYAAPLVSFTTVLLISSIATTTAFNITRILEAHPDFSKFNELLTKNNLVPEINKRKTITVLALSNDRVGVIAGKSEDVQKRILSCHVILDYYDILKLNKLKSTKTTITTLYQASGTAHDQQGFLNVVHKTANATFFGSAVKGSPIDSKVEGSVMSQPYNISVLSVSHEIIAPGIDGTLPPVRAPAPASKVPSPAGSPKEEVAVPAEDEDEAEAPAEAEAPTTPEAPAASPKDSSPAADADTAPPRKSAAGKHMVSGASIGFIVALASTFLAAY